MDIEEPSERFWELIEEAKRLNEQIKPLLPTIVEARRRYMRSRSEEDQTAMERIENEARELTQRHAALEQELRAASGLPDEILAELDKPPKLPGDGKDRLLRKDLVEESVAVTGLVETYLPEALDEVRRLLPPGWLRQQENIPHRLDALVSGEGCLSLVKGLRPTSEFSPLHRLRQMVRVSDDYQNGVLAYDHFAGATLVPQLVQLGTHLDRIRAVKGDVAGRLQRLSHGNGEGTDSTLFELLVAAGCVEHGRNVEFLPETHEKSPDLRCHDPYPLVIECKRKRALSNYELEEEAAMRGLFLKLESEAVKKGMHGRFELRLDVEARHAPADDVVARLISQRLAPHPEGPLQYPWGSVAYRHLPYRMRLPGTTRLYSPHMLAAVFGWNSDLPEWDGIVCRVHSGGEVSVDQVDNPVALVWSNSSEEAVRKRAWSPLDLFGDAVNQIPPGEFGIIYLAYHEGAREEIADRRMQNFMKRITEWEHAASIRIPISFLVRLYPRPLDHGNPDLIESTVRLSSAEYGDPSLFEEFPNSVFTRTPL